MGDAVLASAGFYYQPTWGLCFAWRRFPSLFDAERRFLSHVIYPFEKLTLLLPYYPVKAGIAIVLILSEWGNCNYRVIGPTCHYDVTDIALATNAQSETAPLSNERQISDVIMTTYVITWPVLVAHSSQTFGLHEMYTADPVMVCIGRYPLLNHFRPLPTHHQTVQVYTWIAILYTWIATLYTCIIYQAIFGKRLKSPDCLWRKALV